MTNAKCIAVFFRKSALIYLKLVSWRTAVVILFPPSK